MHFLLMLLSILPASFVALSPVAKVISISAFVYGIIQVLKQAPVLAPYLQGWLAVVINVVLSIAGILMAVPADQMYTTTTFLAVLTAALAAAGVHGTTSKLAARGPQLPAAQPVVENGKVGATKPVVPTPKGALARFFVK